MNWGPTSSSSRQIRAAREFVGWNCGVRHLTASMRTFISILAKWLLIGTVLLAPLAGTYSNNASPLLGILAWFEIIVVGFPWNIIVALTCDVRFEQMYFPGLFRSLNQNHDTTVGYFMFIGYVSVFINSLLLAIVLHFKLQKKKGIPDA